MEIDGLKGQHLIMEESFFMPVAGCFSSRLKSDAWGYSCTFLLRLCKQGL